jgi:hypothetical protein
VAVRIRYRKPVDRRSCRTASATALERKGIRGFAFTVHTRFRRNRCAVRIILPLAPHNVDGSRQNRTPAVLSGVARRNIHANPCSGRPRTRFAPANRSKFGGAALSHARRRHQPPTSARRRLISTLALTRRRPCGRSHPRRIQRQFGAPRQRSSSAVRTSCALCGIGTSRAPARSATGSGLANTKASTSRTACSNARPSPPAQSISRALAL